MPTDIPMFDVLLERMKTHPEEFSEGIESSRWGDIIETYSDCLTDEEKQKLSDGVYTARRQMLNESIMKRLAGEDEGKVIFSAKKRLLFKNKAEEEREMNEMHDYYRKRDLEMHERLNELLRQKMAREASSK